MGNALTLTIIITYLEIMKTLLKNIAITSALFITTSGATYADKISLDEINAYFSSLKTVKTSFEQVNANGSRSTGNVYISRPGKMRFEYNPPNAALVLASSGSIAVYDNKSKSGPSIYPLRRSPLNLILARKVDLNKSDMVIKHTFDGTFTSIVARDPKQPKLGYIQMAFTDNPVQLRQWIITDQSRQRTKVKLGDLKVVKKLPRDLFEIKKPTK